MTPPRLCDFCGREILYPGEYFKPAAGAKFYHPKCKIESHKLRDRLKKEQQKSGL